MLLYDWKSIYKASHGNAREVLRIIETMLRKKRGEVLPDNKRDPLFTYYNRDFRGSSFLKNAEYLFSSDRFMWTHKERADYIGLASFRNYSEYKVTGKLTLDFSLSPLGEDAINKNSLLRLEGNNIHFRFEDYTGEK